MSVRAGSIVFIGGRNVIDRLQSAGLNGNVPIETIREIGNDLVVDKVPGEPDFTFAQESWDVTTDQMAFLTGAMGSASTPPGAGDPDGTEYRWENVRPVHVTSPWKTQTGTQGGAVGGGLIIPNYYPTRLQYRFGVTDNAAQTVELAGGAFYYSQHAPVEETATGDGADDTFITSEEAVPYRRGGGGGTSAYRILGVMVNGVPQTRGTDWEEVVAGGTAVGDAVATTIHFLPGAVPINGAQIRYVYFTTTPKAIPQSMNADVTVKPGAVRGRHICVRIDPDGDNIRLTGVQTVELDATIDGEVEREMCNEEPIGRTINGTDVNGTVTTRPKDMSTLFRQLSAMLGVSQNEVFGYFYQTNKPLLIDILNPRNPAQVIKSIYVEQGQFQPPPMQARVNTSTDFAFQFSALNGTFAEFKGGRA
jgi:hypothetical protein